MRIALLVLALVMLVPACSLGGGGGSDDASGADEVEARTSTAANEAVPVVMETLGASAVEAWSQWQSCMAISWRHEVFGTITAPAGDDAADRLERVRAALVDAGFTDATQVEGHATVERDDVTVDLRRPGAARQPDVWTFSVSSSCAYYGGDDKEKVEDDEATPFDLAP